MRAPAFLVVSLVVGAGLVACSPAPPAGPPSATAIVPTPPPVTQVATTAAGQRPTRINIDSADQYFNPGVITIDVGASVTWNNVQGTHNVVARDGAFTSPILYEGSSYSHTFTTRGEFPYVCTFHEGAGMFGEVDVE